MNVKLLGDDAARLLVQDFGSRLRNIHVARIHHA
jgi:hypothetical protein